MAATRRNAAGKVDRAAGAADPYDPLFERLAQRLQRGHRELAEFVEEQDAVGGQTDFARAQGPAPAAHERDDRGLVVRRPEGWALEQRVLGQGAACGRMDTGHRERLVPSERWEQSDQALGEHGLARPGRPDHEEVVAPRRRNLNGSAAQGLAPHVGEVGLGGSTGCRRRRRRCGGPASLAAKHAHQIGQSGRAVSVLSAHECRLPHVAERHHQAEWRGSSVGQRDHARYVAERAIESQLAAEGEAIGAGSS